MRDAPVFERPYGDLQLLCGPKQSCMATRKADLKVLRIRPGQRTSHHFHMERESIFYVASGNVIIRSQNSNQQLELSPGDSVVVDPGEDHELENAGQEDALVWEIESPPHSGIDRIEVGDARGNAEIDARTEGRFWQNDGATKVKICGIKSLDAAIECLRLGVDAIGLHAVGYQGIESVMQARGWLGVLPDEISVFLLTDTLDLAVLRELVSATRCDTVQIQGSPPVSSCAMVAGFVRQLRRRVVCTVSAEMGSEIDEVLQRVRDVQAFADAILFDSGRYGGTGVVHDWSITGALAKRIGVPIIVAGGLNPENCGACINELKPYGIDVESGVELRFNLSDGKRLTAKNFDAIRSLIATAKHFDS